MCLDVFFFFCLPYLGFVEYLGSLNLQLLLNVDKFWLLFLQTFLLFSLSFSGTLVTCVLDCLILSTSHRNSGVVGFCFQFFFYLFCFDRFIAISSCSLLFSSSMSNCINSI